VKLEEIKTVANLLNSSNFCDLVKRYSEDAATVDKCGAYQFTQGQLLSEFESAVFNSTIGSTNILQTRLGYHIVEIINVTKPVQMSFEESKAKINDYFLLANKQTALNNYIKQLREKAKIVSYVS
jgi:parvulin-like peptidyl-prolyl isomerase